MYPNLYFAFLDLLGWDLPALKLINSFGFFVALAFVVAHGLLRSELKRMTALGHFTPSSRTERIGEPPHPLDLGMQALMGFLLGWKVLYLVVNAGDLFQGGGLPQAHLFSTEGNVVWGVLGALALTGWRYWEVQQARLPEPKTVAVEVPPHEHVGGVTAAAAIGGIAGAKLFHLLEYPDEFVAFLQAPSLNAFLGGLTIYGGLIVGGLSVYVYARRHNLNFLETRRRHGAWAVARLRHWAHRMSSEWRWRLGHPQPQPQARMAVLGARLGLVVRLPQQRERGLRTAVGGLHRQTHRPQRPSIPSIRRLRDLPRPRRVPHPDLRNHGRGPGLCHALGHADQMGQAGPNFCRLPDVQRV